MKYRILEKSWAKRRKLEPSLAVEHIEFIDLQQKHNHICKMLVRYADQSQQTLIARVVYNPLKQYWTVDGMKVAVIIEQW